MDKIEKSMIILSFEEMSTFIDNSISDLCNMYIISSVDKYRIQLVKDVLYKNLGKIILK